MLAAPAPPLTIVLPIDMDFPTVRSTPGPTMNTEELAVSVPKPPPLTASADILVIFTERLGNSRDSGIVAAAST
jgi:hypothetical protein